MPSDVRIEPAAARILVFEEVYQARAAQEQAEKSKLDAFGTLARLNPLNRPKHDTVLLSKWELRHEPFWHVVARREVDFNHEANYSLPITNPHAQRIEVAGRSFEVLSAGNKPRVDLPCSEVCHRKVEAIIYQDALKRPVKSAALQSYVEKYTATEQEQGQRDAGNAKAGERPVQRRKIVEDDRHDVSGGLKTRLYWISQSP